MKRVLDRLFQSRLFDLAMALFEKLTGYWILYDGERVNLLRIQ